MLLLLLLLEVKPWMLILWQRYREQARPLFGCSLPGVRLYNYLNLPAERPLFSFKYVLGVSHLIIGWSIVDLIGQAPDCLRWRAWRLLNGVRVVVPHVLVVTQAPMAWLVRCPVAVWCSRESNTNSRWQKQGGERRRENAVSLFSCGIKSWEYSEPRHGMETIHHRGIYLKGHVAWGMETTTHTHTLKASFPCSWHAAKPPA